MKNFFSKHLGLKILCLILASGLWIFVSASNNKTEFFPGEIPIYTKNLPSQWAAVYDQFNAKVKISASAGTWSKLTEEDFQVYLDLNNKGIGTYEVEPKVAIALAGVEIVQVQPEKIRVRIEQATSRNLNLAVKFSGSVADGFEINSVKLDPKKVEAWGAKSVLEKLVQATAQVKLNGDDRDFERQLKISALDENDKEMPLIRFNPERVLVSVTLSRKGGGKIVGIKPKVIGNPAHGYWISAINYEPKYVKIKGSEQTLTKTEFLETEEINVENIDSNRKFESKIILPKTLSLVDSETKIQVEINVSMITQTKEIQASINFVNTDSNLVIKDVEPRTVSVIASGSVWALNNANSENVVINLDLKNKKAGKIDFNLTKDSFSYPQNISINSFIPNIIRVTLEDKE